MKVLLCHAYFMKDDSSESRINKPYPPLGLLSISAYLEKKNIDHDVFDSTFSEENELLNQVEKNEYGVIGIYCNLMTKINVIRIIAEIKKISPKSTVVLGGPDIRYNVENYLNAGGDVVVIGEGEESMAEIVQNAGSKSFENIKGIAFKKGEEIIVNDERPFIKDFDELPLPSYQKINIEKYLDHWKKWHGISMLNVSTQRGCPYTCRWCSTAVYGQSYRRRSPEKVVEDLEKLQKTYEVDSFWFVDDVFTVSHKWLEHFNDELKRKNVKISYECITRADRMNDKVIALLRDSGCFRVWIGAESGSQKILDAMDRRVSKEDVRENIIKTKKAGMEAGTFIMLGYPGETVDDIQETIEHLVISHPDHYTVTLAYPIKGTGLYEDVAGIMIGEHDWEHESDRQRNFKRTYKDSFYKHAIRHLVNEVNYQHNKIEKGSLSERFLFKIKSGISGIQMKLST